MLIPVSFTGRALDKNIQNNIKNKSYSVEELNTIYKSILSNIEKGKNGFLANAIIFFIVFGFISYQIIKIDESNLAFGIIFGIVCYSIVLFIFYHFMYLSKKQFIKLIKENYSERYESIIKQANSIINDNINYGGFIISKNITQNGVKAKWVFREMSSIKECNGWNIYSENDNQEYISNPNNFEIVSIESIKSFVPMILTIFNAPYGTNLTIKYENDVPIGFIDTKTGQDVTVDKVLKK